MQRVVLGKTNIEVSRLALGTLTIGPLQANLSLEEGADILAYAISRGINFFDTAQLYQTYPYLKRAMEISGKKDIVISSKTYAYSRQDAAKAVEDARTKLDRDYVDIFMLHEQESIHTLRGHRDALEYLFECKQRGIVRAVGASMHHIAAVEGGLKLQLDCLHPILNFAGLGIVDGSRGQMEDAISHAHNSGMGIFSMKSLGGGNLFSKASECFEYILAKPFIDSVAVGMQSIEEIDANIEFFKDGAFSQGAIETLSAKERKLHIDDWCNGCGSCALRCSQKALTVSNGKAFCNNSICILCGYCATVCPQWAIKVV